MTTNFALDHARQVKKIANNLTELSQQIMRDNRDKPDYRYNTSAYQHISSLTQQLASMHVYLNDVLERLEWKHYIWTRLKKELSTVSYVLFGMLLGIAISLPHIVR